MSALKSALAKYKWPLVGLLVVFTLWLLSFSLNFVSQQKNKIASDSAYKNNKVVGGINLKNQVTGQVVSVDSKNNTFTLHAGKTAYTVKVASKTSFAITSTPYNTIDSIGPDGKVTYKLVDPKTIKQPVVKFSNIARDQTVTVISEEDPNKTTTLTAVSISILG